MHQVKIFKSVESEVESLEQSVNQWLAESGARVVQITGNISPQTNPLEGGNSGGSFSAGGGGPLRYPPSDILLVVLYETA